MAMSGLLLAIAGVAGCAVMIAALVLAVWAIAQNRRPPST
jgi:hypothetical protein